jgi:hypothetical protein
MLRLIAFIASLLISMPAAAASCGEQQSVKQAYSAAQNVFSAHVEDIYVAPGFGRDDFHFAKLRILQVWKGNLHPGDVVSTTAEDSISFVSDGFAPLQGSDVLVYSGGPQPFVLGTCSRSGLLESTRDLQALKKLSRRAHGG